MAVYLIQAVDGGPIKIGYSAQLNGRLDQIRAAELKKGRDTTFVVRGVQAGSRSLERELHERFDAYRIEGEWFADSPEIQEFITLECSGWDGADDDPKRTLVSFKTGVVFEQWFDDLCKFTHLPPTILMEHALRVYAEQQGFPEPQPRR